MRQYTVKRYRVETPEQLKALHDIAPDDNHSLWMLARVWSAEKRRRASLGDERPVVVCCVSFETGTRRCQILRQAAKGAEVSGVIPYNDALRYFRENNLKLMEPEELP